MTRALLRPLAPLAFLLACSTPSAATDPGSAVDAPGPTEAPATPPPTPETAPDAPAPPPPRWSPEVRPLSETERAAMTGVSWREGCPVHLDDLRVLELDHHTPEGSTTRGRLVVNVDAADALVQAFEGLWKAGFPITSMRPVRHFGGDDDASMTADNTSAFNCRPVAGGRKWSQHAYGRAVDVNPLRNPYVRGERVDPPEGAAWLDRDPSRPGVLVEGTPAVEAFDAVGWHWGGRWRSSKDYQHFSKTGG